MADSYSETVELKSGGEKVPGFLSQPIAPGVYPGVIVIQEWNGIADHIKEVCIRLARQGYVALAPDLYHGTIGRTPEQNRGLSQNLDDVVAYRDLSAGIDYLRGRPGVRGERIGCIGFCMGGRQSLLLACQNQNLAAGVVYYGSIYSREITAKQPKHPIDLVPGLACPLLGIFGEADAGIPMEHVGRLREALTRHKKTFEIHSYPGAQHAFANDTNPERYHPQATQDAWAQTLAFYQKHLKG